MNRTKRRGLRLLSIDWDYFIPTYPLDKKLWMLYDWSMNDSPFYRESHMWIHRGAGFLMNDLPLPDTTGLEQTFWGRFKFAEGTRLYYGDSHLYAALIPENEMVEDVWNFDAHHDLGYHGTRESVIEKNRLACDDWLGWYGEWGAKTRVFYPRWRPNAMKDEGQPVFKGIRKIDNDQPVSVPFHAVYVCRSSSWSPAWLDAKFKAFVEACPLKSPVNLQEDYDAMTPREFSIDDITREAEMFKAAKEAR